MKYDIITAINNRLEKCETETKNKIQLSKVDERMIKFIQNQHLPELDGLKFYGIARNFGDEKNLLETVFYNRMEEEYRMTCQHFEDNKKSEIIVYNSFTPEFRLEIYGKMFSLDYQLFCWYQYGDDIITFNINPNLREEILKIEIYINAKDDLKYNEYQDSTIELVPDIIVAGKYQYDYSTHEHYLYIDELNQRINLNDKDTLLSCRVLCNSLADKFHEKYESYMIVKR